MIVSHQQQLETRLPRIGVIRKGAPKSERAPGKDLHYFRLDRADISVLRLWAEVMGDEPVAISGVLPYADPAECLSIWDELWQGKRLLWRGDGERLHVQLQGAGYVRFAPGEGPAQPAAAGQKVDGGKVARISRLRLLLPQLRVAGIFEVSSTSAIDADELWSNLMWIRSTVPTLQGAPVTVFRAARQFNIPGNDGKTMAVTKHMLHMMLDGRYLEALMPVAGMLPAAGLPAESDTASLPALPAPVASDEFDVYDDDEELPAAAPVRHATTPSVLAQQTGAQQTQPAPRPAAAIAPAGPMPDDELEVYEVAPSAFMETVAMLMSREPEAVMSRLKTLGYSKVPADPHERLAMYRKLKAVGVGPQTGGLQTGGLQTGGPQTGNTQTSDTRPQSKEPVTDRGLFDDEPDAAATKSPATTPVLTGAYTE